MFHDSLDDLLRVVLVGPAVYAWLVLVLRTIGKRTLAQLNAFDFIVTVALGSTLATVLLSSDVSWTEGALALVVLALLQYVAAWVSVRSARARSALISQPVRLLVDGQMDREAMLAQRVSEEDVRQAVRGAGLGCLGSVAALVLETNGTFSVIPTDALGSGSALDDLRDDVRRT